MARRRAGDFRRRGDRGPGQAHGDRRVLPVVAEELAVEKRPVPTGGVRVRKTVEARQVVVDEPLLRETAEIERVVVNRPVDAVPPIREEGDTLVVPLVEETLVLEKRLVLTEEIRITRRRVETRAPRGVTLRSEKATVERMPAGEPLPPPDAAA